MLWFVVVRLGVVCVVCMVIDFGCGWICLCLGWVGGLWFGLIVLLLIVLCTVSFGGLRLYLWFLFPKCGFFEVGCIVVAWLCFDLGFGFVVVLVVVVFAGVACGGVFVGWQLLVCYAGLGVGFVVLFVGFGVVVF